MWRGGLTLETVFEGVLDQVVVTDNALIVGRFNASTGNVTLVTLVTNDACRAADIYASTAISQIAATPDTVYVIAYDSGAQVLNAVSLSGVVERVDLGALFDGQGTYPSPWRWTVARDGSPSRRASACHTRRRRSKHMRTR